MNHIISLSKLKDNLAALSPSDESGINMDLFDGTKYLYKNAVTPLFAGKFIRIGSLDFNAFDFEDTIELSDFLEESGIDMLEDFEQTRQKLISTAPEIVPVSYV